MRSENNLKTPKFHWILHVVYITEHGCPMMYGGSRGENFGKLELKDNVKITNKVKDNLNFDVSCRIDNEYIIIDNISTT